jgi:hypothetical protein
MSNSSNERMAELEEKVKRLQENNEAWRKTVTTLNRIPLPLSFLGFSGHKVQHRKEQ